MSRLAHVQSVLDQYAAEIGLPGIPLDERQHAAIQVGDSAVLFAHGSEPLELLWLHCRLGTVDEDDDAAAAFLLQAGGEAWFSTGITVGLGGDGKTAFAFIPVAVGMLSLESLRDSLGQLLEAGFMLRERLASRDFTPRSTESGDAGQPQPAPGLSEMPGRLIRP